MATHRPNSKISKIKRHLLAGNSITPLQALGLYGAFRLAADIERLRNEMFVITTIKTAPTGNTYAEYAVPQVGTKVRRRSQSDRGVGIVCEAGPHYIRVKWADTSYGTYIASTQDALEGV